MDQAWIGSPNDGVRLQPGRIEPDGSVVVVVALLRADGLEARRAVVHHYSRGFDDLVGYFANLERDWRGWKGERTWESLEGDLAFSAVHDGHIALTVSLRQSVPDGWSAKAHLRIDPGEQLSVVVRDLRSVVGSRA